MRVLSSLVLAALAVTLVVAWPFEREPGPENVRFVRGGVVIAERDLAAVGRLSSRRKDRLVRRLARNRRVRQGPAELVMHADRRAVERGLKHALASGGKTVVVPERAVASGIRVPVVKQALRNNCETAALAMLLAGQGKRTDQLTLQRRLARSGSLDPRTGPDGMLVWGDPRIGFVGRPDGGGAAGGYGVYERPIRDLAERHGLELADLTGGPARRVYGALLEGKPVMAWVGLSDGPYRTWKTPAGRTVVGNFGEHTVLLTGVGDGYVSINDPLSGRRARWTRADFELMWERLGRRALST